MKLKQKSIFSSSETFLSSDKIIHTRRSILGLSKIEIPFESIDLQREIKRNHIEAPISVSVVVICLLLTSTLLNKFKIYSNEDLFVVLCGLILIISIGFRLLQSNFQKQIVIPTFGLGEVIIWQDRPDRKSVDMFMQELKLAILKHYENKTGRDLDPIGNSEGKP